MTQATDWSKVAMPPEEVTFPEGTLVKIGGIPFWLAAETVLHGCASNKQAAIELNGMKPGDTLQA